MEAALPRRPRRLSARGRRVLDVAIAGLLTLACTFGSWSISVPAAALAFAQTVPLFWRRSHPRAAFAAVAAAMALQSFFVQEPLPSQLAFPVALYSLSRHGSAVAGRVGLGVGIAGAFVATSVWLQHWDNLALDAAVPYVLTLSAIVIAAWALGTLGRTRQAYIDALVEHADQLTREAAQRARLAAVDERARIAREMHDVVAHGLSVVVVQADGARYAARADPAAAERALGTIAETSRQSLREMRRMLGLLRAEDESVETSPQPRLVDLADLVEQTRTAGTEVTAALPPGDAAVPDGVALTVYRVVQESLSNVRRHAGPGARAGVGVHLDTAAVTVTVIDDGRGAAAADGDGHGLRGMAERVAAHDGDLDTGPLTGGGFRVAARLPL